MKTARALEISDGQASQVEKQEFSSVNSVRYGNQQYQNTEVTVTQDPVLRTNNRVI